MSKVQVIRELISQGITAPKAIVAAAKEKGVELTANYVSLVKSKEKAAGADGGAKRIKNIQKGTTAKKESNKPVESKAEELSPEDKKTVNDVAKEMKKIIDNQSRIEMRHMEAASALYAVCGRDLGLMQAVVLRFVSWVR